MLRNIDDIPSIFRVSVHSDTILSNDSRLGEMLEKIELYRRYIADISVTQRYFDDNIDGNQRME